MLERPGQGLGVTALAWNFWFDKIRELRKRLLPTEIAHLDRNYFRQSSLNNVHCGAARHLLERDSDLNLTRQVRIIEFIRVSDKFARHQFLILSTE
jgi:hypothetical protein